MHTPATSPAAPPARASRQWLGHALARVKQLTRYHGIWGPGVNLLRNLPLRYKTLIVGLVMGLVLGTMLVEALLLRTAQWQEAQQALQAGPALRTLTELEAAALEISQAAAQADRGAGADALAPALQREAQRFAAEQAAIGKLAGWAPVLARAQTLLESRRAALRDEHAAPAAGQPGARTLAAWRYAEASEPLRYELMLLWSARLGADIESRVLLEGLVMRSDLLQLPLYKLLQQAQALAAAPALPEQRQALVDQLTEVRLVRQLSWPALERVRALAPERALELDSVTHQLNEVLALVTSLAQPADAAAPVDVRARARLKELSAQGLAGVQRMHDLGLQHLHQRLQARADALRTKTLAEATLLGLCALLTVYLLVCTYKVLAGGLNFLCGQVDELGRGNLAIRPAGHGNDEIGRALRVLSQTATQMSSLFEAVQRGVAAVSHASRMVASGNAGLSDRTGEIRGSIAGVSDSTKTFSASMDRCNDAVDRAADHVRTMRAEGQRCRKAMTQLQERMRSLQRKSREIEQVVAMVESVAYQTRLLAINASVEAARAGAAGKGFAVVAQEVRTLASRSADASHRIRDIVAGSITEIDSGHQMSERLGQALVRSDQEVEAANAVMSLMVGLVRTSQAQSVEVLDITRRVDESIGENSRLVQQLSVASAELRDEGDTLKRSIQHFEFG